MGSAGGYSDACALLGHYLLTKRVMRVIASLWSLSIDRSEYKEKIIAINNYHNML